AEKSERLQGAKESIFRKMAPPRRKASGYKEPKKAFFTKWLRRGEKRAITRSQKKFFSQNGSAAEKSGRLNGKSRPTNGPAFYI
ncbi:MAG: hypothetical protein IJQ21_10065, partial [Lachnospiraceae bacterium]|nr:hypothetical protein [Lachnospiraceae bacterium]